MFIPAEAKILGSLIGVALLGGVTVSSLSLLKVRRQNYYTFTSDKQ